MSLVEHLFDQSTQTKCVQAFASTLSDEDEDEVAIKAALLRITTSSAPRPLELTWCVLCIFYVCADEMITMLEKTTPRSLMKSWFGTAAEYRTRLEGRLCGRFARGPGRARSKVEQPCMTPLEIVSAAQRDLVFEVTKPPDIVARECGWDGAAHVHL